MDRKTAEASRYHNKCLNNLDKSFNSKQKFQIGEKVKIAKDLGVGMSHFRSDFVGTIGYTYSQMYGGNNYESYSIIDENGGSNSWYMENQLTKIKG